MQTVNREELDALVERHEHARTQQNSVRYARQRAEILRALEEMTPEESQVLASLHACALRRGFPLERLAEMNTRRIIKGVCRA